MRWRGGEEPWGRGAKRRAERASPKPFLTPYTICSFGQVFKGTYRGMVVAVKTMNVVEQDSLERFRAEILLLKDLRHNNIVVLIGACWERR